MQDEILKHTKKVYKEIKHPKHSFSEKLKEITIEVCIIVFAVTLSIWLHSWSEHRHEVKEANTFLLKLKDDLKKNIEVLETNKQVSIHMDSNCAFLQKIDETTPYSEIWPHTDFAWYKTFYNTGQYEGFKSSGKIGTIENDSLKNAILFYFQQTLPNLNYDVSIITSYQMESLRNYQNSPEAMNVKDYYNSRQSTSMLLNLGYSYKQSITTFENVINETKKIITYIDKEVGN